MPLQRGFHPQGQRRRTTHVGETCHQYLSKGSKVFVRGYPEVHAFARRDGEPSAALKVTAQTVQFLSGKASGAAERELEEGEEDEAPF